MNELGNRYALAALRERRAEMAGELVLLERKLRALRESIKHMDCTLRLFDPDADPSKISPKGLYKRSKLFGAGKLNRMILGALRAGRRPMSTAEVVDAVAAQTEFGPDAAAGLRSRVRANLVYLTKVRDLVVKEGERERARWGLKASPTLS